MRFALVVLLIGACSAQSLEECLQKDSISCVQRSLFKRAKEFFDRDSFDLLTGVSLVKSSKDDRSGARSSPESAAASYEQELDKAESVAERQSALENYVGEGISNFFFGRSLRINFGPVVDKIGESARALSDSIPAEVKQVATDVAEGRGKKKLMKSLMPLLMLAKVKLVGLATLAILGTALFAKKALLNSLVALAIMGFMSMRSFFSKQGPEVSAYSAWNPGSPVSSGWASPSVVSSGSTGWSSGAASGWADDTHGAYSGQNQAYSGYRP